MTSMLAEFRPDLVGCTAVSSDYQSVLALAEKVRAAAPQVPILFGGVHPTLVPETVIAEPCVDMVCVGEGEEALLELAEDMERGGQRRDIRNLWFKDGNNRVIQNPVRPLVQDLDRYGFPDDDLFYEQMPPSYRMSPSVMASRGCPYRCSYCGNDSMQSLYKGLGRYVRIRSVEHVLRELKWRRDRHGSRHFVFMDDVFAARRSWIEEFARRFPKEVGGSYNCLAHIHAIDREKLEWLKESGCTFINFGLQTGSERLRREVLFRKETNARMIEIAGICKEIGLRFAVDHMLNLPGEKEEDILKSAALYNKIRPDLINVYGLVYFPKAKITEIALSKGMLKPENRDDIRKTIERGEFAVHQSPWLTRGGVALHGHYRRYALFLMSIPLLPPFILHRMLQSSRKWFGLFERMPLPLLAGVKMLANIRAGMGFILWNILRNQLYYLKRSFRKARKDKTPRRNGSSGMRILMLNNGIPTENGMSGSDRRAVHWSRFWHDQGHIVEILAPEFVKDRYPFAGRFFPSFPSGRNLHPLPLYLLRTFFASVRILGLRRRNYDVVYSSSDLIPDAIPALLLRLSRPGTRWISGLHLIAPSPWSLSGGSAAGGRDPKRSFRSVYHYVTQRIIRSAMKRWSFLIFVSNPRDREELLASGFPDDRVLVTPGAPEWELADRFHGIRKEIDVCFIARDHPQKGWSDMIRIWRKVREQMPGAVLHIIGDMPEARLKKLLSSHGLSFSGAVVYHGFLDGEEKYHLLAKARLLAFPSRHESFGMVVAEAQSLGIPVVAYDLDFFRFVYPVGMFRIPVGDIESFAETIVELLSDTEQYRTAGEEGRAYARDHFRFQKSGREILDRFDFTGECANVRHCRNHLRSA